MALVSSFTLDARIVRASAGDDTHLPAGAFCRRVLDAGEPFASDTGSIHSAPELDEAPSPMAYLGVPLRLADGRLIGTLCVADVPTRRWSDDDRMLMAALTVHLLVAIERTTTPVDALPRAGPRTASTDVRLDATTPRVEATSGPTGRILLADDLDLNRRLIADMLAIEGHVVDCVADGAAALAAVGANAYDLILMDMIMPGMGGIEATQAIRALPAPAGTVPIIALTANTYPEQLESCLAAGMNATLTKPMSFDALAATVATWLRGGVRPPPSSGTIHSS